MVIPYTTPVSYTHLDVYKRQRKKEMKKGIAFLLALAMSVPLIGCSSDGGTSSGSGEGNSQAASQTGDESSASGDKIVLDVVTMTGYGNGLEANKEFMKKYTEEVNPNVEINLEELSIDGSEWNVYVSCLLYTSYRGTHLYLIWSSVDYYTDWKEKFDN